MITEKQCLAKFGEPNARSPWLKLWDVPADLEIGVIPKQLYCNILIVDMLQMAFINMIERGYAESELLAFDGCFNIRRMKRKVPTENDPWSLHSWGLPIDINAFENQYGAKPIMSPGLVQCWTDAGWEWGGKWKIPDGMHMQPKNI